MTTIRLSSLGTIAVPGGAGAASGVRFSQLGIISIANPPVAVGLRISSLGTIAVVSNAKAFQPLGEPVKLGCWTPCGTLIWDHYNTRSKQ
jgi:hypothetical protein